MRELQSIGREYKNFSDKFREIKQNEFIKLLHHWDEDFFIAKPKHLISKDKITRNIWFPGLGIISFKRRRYYNKKTRKYEFLLDKYLNIPKNSILLNEYHHLPLLYYEMLGSYKKISEAVFDGNITKSTICRYMKKIDVDISYKNFICEDDGILWINIDGLFVNNYKSKKKNWN